ncbi:MULTISPECIES: hypothetical protein [Chromobacterium]|nr:MULTISPECIES: hypothetical protein [Chromobacterium]WSE92072.1 hypothetical protein U6115_02165 [Chromobacterium subtsugae]WVH60446.1 hypothetical protein U6151_02165 [Chromobacterium subtsugae]
MIFSGNENWLAWQLKQTAQQALPRVEWLKINRPAPAKPPIPPAR